MIKTSIQKSTLLLLFITFSVSVLAQKNSIIWEALLQNDRTKALELVKENNNSNNLESILLKKIVEVENGQLNYDLDFLKQFASQDDFEYYLYALWMQPYFFTDYLENGFFDDYDKIIAQINENDITNSTVKSGYKYLSAITKRSKNDWSGFKSKLSEINVMKDWEFSGVYENINSSGIDIEYEPEIVTKQNKVFSAQSNGFSQWYRVNKSDNEVYSFFTNHSEYGSGVHYAQTFLQVQEDERVVLKLGKEGLVKVWLNDVLIIDEDEMFGTELDAISYEVNLSQGVNRILIKQASESTPYFILRLETLDGKPLSSNIKTSFKNRAYKPSTQASVNPKFVKHPVEAFFENRINNNIGDNNLNTYSLYNTYYRNGKMAKAQEVLLTLYDAYPQSSFLNTNLTRVYESLGNDTNAEKLKRNLLRQDPDYFVSFFLEYEDFEKLLKLDIDTYMDKMSKMKLSTDLPYFKNFAEILVYIRQQDLAKIRVELDELLEDPTLPGQFHHTFSEFYSELFNDDNATIEALEYFYKKEFSWNILTYLSYYYKKQNRIEDALKLYTDLLNHLSSDNETLYQIIKILHENLQFERSMPYIDQALKNFPNSYLFLDFKADALLQMNKKEDAMKLYEKLLLIRPSNSEIRQKIRDYKKTKNPLEAYEVEDFYDYISTHRNTIKTNNYGLNTLLNQTNILSYKNGGGEYYTTLIYEVTSQNGIDIFKEYNLGLSGNYLINKSELVKTDGSIVPADRSGSKLVFDQLEIGDVVLINYWSNYRGTGRFYNDHVLAHNFFAYHPTISNNYRFITDLKELNFENPSDKVKYSVKKMGALYVHDWSAQNLEALPVTEDYMPYFNDVSGRLHLSTIKSWNDVALWYSDLVRNQLKKDKLVIDVFNELFPDGYKQFTEKERAKTIYYYIADNFNYSFVNFRQSGYVPQKPSKTINTKLGDCKDLSSLFLILAEQAEINTNLVLILTSDYAKQSLKGPSTDFNHCIVRVKLDGDYYFLELTDKNLPFLSLPVSLREAIALNIPTNIASNTVSDLFFLQTDNREKTILKSEVHLKLNESDSKVNLISTINGHLASYYISTYSKEKGELLNESLFKDIDGRTRSDVELIDVKKVNYNKDKGEFVFDVDLDIDLEVNKIGDYYTFVVPRFLDAYDENIISLKARNYPIDYRMYENSDAYIETITIELLDDYKFVELPESQALKFNNHEFNINYKLNKINILNVEISANVNTDSIDADSYKEFRKYVKSILKTRDNLIKYKKI